jgi:hypothetical protein
MSAPKFTITSDRRRPYSERMLHSGFNVFPDSNASKMIDEFFSKHKIYTLDFKSKTWAKMVRLATKLNVEAMRTVFGKECEITYSIYAGCSMCPCSPGYRVRKSFGEANRKYINHDIWGKIVVDTSPISAKLKDFEKALKAEIKAHKETLATA